MIGMNQPPFNKKLETNLHMIGNQIHKPTNKLQKHQIFKKNKSCCLLQLQLLELLHY
jgi:hypothetical protein